jgi:hypothetical protein
MPKAAAERYSLRPDQEPLPQTPLERFARTLRMHIYGRGGFVYLTDFARAVERELGSEFGKQTLGAYLKGLNWPQQPRLNAMAKVLKLKPEELIPMSEWGNVRGALDPSGQPPRAEPVPESPFSMTLEDGQYRVRLNVLVDLETAMKITQLAMANGT